MIAVDTNLLVYAHRRESIYHDAAFSLLRQLAQGDDAWAIPWPCCHEFLSVATNPRIWRDSASSQEEAWRQLLAWAASPSVRLLQETDDFLEILERFVKRPLVIGGVVHDAKIAALCAAHGVEVLLTRDRDFSLFPELKTRDPVTG